MQKHRGLPRKSCTSHGSAPYRTWCTDRPTDRQTDRPTDLPTDIVTYRAAEVQLKTTTFCIRNCGKTDTNGLPLGKSIVLT